MIKSHFDRLKASFHSGKYAHVANRKKQLRNLLRFLTEKEKDICVALAEDLGKPRFETLTSEIGLCRAEARYALRHLNEWTSPKSVSTPITQLFSRASYAFEPKGVVLIFGSWNFPFQLIVAPLIGALAAGNTVIVKPSEHAPATSRLLSRLLPHYLDIDCVQVIEGDENTSQEILKLNFDHIFFTGSTRIGRIVMEAAAKNLTPVTLELGGKCSAVVDGTSDVALSARRILWGRLMNAGQACLAPDFVFVQKAHSHKLVASMKNEIHRFYGPDASQCPDYGKIISKNHLLRLQALLKDQKVICGGQVDADDRFMAPTLVLNPPLDSDLMQQEIFGPILPIIEYDEIDEAIDFISKTDKPLAIYAFSNNKEHIDLIRSRCASGAFYVNDTVSHVAVPTMPFGGIGPSGMGAYHGEDGFQAFSYKRAYFRKSNWLDLPMRYAPYKKWKEKVAQLFLR